MRTHRQPLWHCGAFSYYSSPLLPLFSTPSAIAATDLRRYFDDKIVDVRTVTADAHSPTRPSHQRPPAVSVGNFSPVTQADVIALGRSPPNNQCSSDPLPTMLLKANVDLLAPFLCRLINRSFEHGVVPSRFKPDHVKPLLKKTVLDRADVKSSTDLKLIGNFKVA